MAVILTLTPNPALDISTSVPRVAPGRKLRCTGESRDPGGGGVNVARVAVRLGAEAVALYPAGGPCGAELERLVRAEGVRSLVLPIAGATRADVTVLDETTREQYRFVLPGPKLSEAEWMKLLKQLAAFEGPLEFVCGSGSLPRGAPEDFYARAADIVHARGAKFALDTAGAALEAALRAPVFLIKPNLGELRELMGGALDDDRSLLAACRELLSASQVQVIALTLGADGALLVTRDAAWRAPALEVDVLSTVGAGDSFLGAMLSALAAGADLVGAFRHGVAAGAAALRVYGTDLASAAEVRRLLPRVMVQPVSEAIVTP